MAAVHINNSSLSNYTVDIATHSQMSHPTPVWLRKT